MQNLRDAIAFEVTNLYPMLQHKDAEVALQKAVKKAIKTVIRDTPEDTKFVVHDAYDEMTIGYVNLGLVLRELYYGAVDGTHQGISTITSGAHFAVAMFFVSEFDWIDRVVSENFHKFEIVFTPRVQEHIPLVTGPEVSMAHELLSLIKSQVKMLLAAKVCSEPSNG